MVRGKNIAPGLWMPPGMTLPPDRPRIDIMRHEAGHMVVGRVMGFKTGDMIWKPSQAGAVILPEPDIKDIPSLISYLERRIPVLYAGAMSEAKSGKDVLEMLKDDRAKDDFSKIRELLQLYTSLNRGHLTSAEVHQKNNNRLWHRTDILVDKYKPKIVALSKLFFEKIGGQEDVTISASEIAGWKVFSDLPEGCEVVAMSNLEAPDSLKSEDE